MACYFIYLSVHVIAICCTATLMADLPQTIAHPFSPLKVAGLHIVSHTKDEKFKSPPSGRIALWQIIIFDYLWLGYIVFQFIYGNLFLNISDHKQIQVHFNIICVTI